MALTPRSLRRVVVSTLAVVGSIDTLHRVGFRNAFLEKYDISSLISSGMSYANISTWSYGSVTGPEHHHRMNADSNVPNGVVFPSPDEMTRKPPESTIMNEAIRDGSETSKLYLDGTIADMSDTMTSIKDSEPGLSQLPQDNVISANQPTQESFGATTLGMSAKLVLEYFSVFYGLLELIIFSKLIYKTIATFYGLRDDNEPDRDNPTLHSRLQSMEEAIENMTSNISSIQDTHIAQSSKLATIQNQQLEMQESAEADLDKLMTLDEEFQKTKATQKYEYQQELQDLKSQISELDITVAELSMTETQHSEEVEKLVSLMQTENGLLHRQLERSESEFDVLSRLLAYQPKPTSDFEYFEMSDSGKLSRRSSVFSKTSSRRSSVTSECSSQFVVDGVRQPWFLRTWKDLPRPASSGSSLMPAESQ